MTLHSTEGAIPATSTKNLARVAAAATALLVAAGCSSGSTSDDTTASPGTDSSPATGATSDTPLKFGYVLPETGPLAFLGPPQIEALKFAIQTINEAGGVLGNEVADPISGDEAGDAAVAAASATRVLSDDVNVVIGAAASGMSLAIIDQITGAGVAQCSGSNTAPTFTDYDDNGLYFRTAPSDAIQGPVLADVIVADGHSNIAIVARADDYGRGLAGATAEALTSAGATVALNETYDGAATNFAAVVQQVQAASPDAVVVIAFEEGAQIIRGLIGAGMTPSTTGMYGADGLRSEDLASLVDPNNPAVLDGMKGAAPASAENAAFTSDLKAFAPSLDAMQFAPQVFDCTILMALAATKAESTDANVFKEHVNELTRPGGEECSTFADCKALLEDGKDISYTGASGELAFTDAGEPSKATIEVYGYDASGELSTLETKEGSVE